MVMEKQEQKNFLSYCGQKRYPRQVILFDYFLDQLFKNIEQNQKIREPLCLPHTTIFHLFMYVGLVNYFEVNKESEPSLLTSFPQWLLEFKPYCDMYARWVPTEDFICCPFLSFVHSCEGICRRTSPLSQTEDKAIRICLGLSNDCCWRTEELMKLVFEYDDKVIRKTDFDASLQILWQHIENWPVQFLRKVRPFATLGFLAFLAMPQDLFSQVLTNSLLIRVELSKYYDLFLVMNKVLQDANMLKSHSFTNLSSQSLMECSIESDYFVNSFISLMQEDFPLVFERMRKHQFIYYQN